MRKIFLLSVLLCYYFAAVSQRAVIDSSVYDKWPQFAGPAQVSNDGRFVSYTITNFSTGANSLIVQETNGPWKRSFTGGRPVGFSEDSRHYVFQLLDTLFILFPGEEKKELISNVSSSKLPRNSGRHWVAYQLKNEPKNLSLLNLASGKRVSYPNVIDYVFEDSGKVLLTSTAAMVNGVSQMQLHWIQLPDCSIRMIWSACSSNETVIKGSYSFDRKAEQLVFVKQDKTSGSTQNSIWYYRQGNEKAELAVDSAMLESELLIINSIPRFTANGRFVLFNAKSSIAPLQKKNDLSHVDVWNHKDVTLQSQQLFDIANPQMIAQLGRSVSNNVFTMCYNVDAKKSNRLEFADEALLTNPSVITGDYAIVSDRKSVSEPWWAHTPRPNQYLVSLKDNSRILLQKDINTASKVLSFSPSGNYLVYYDDKIQSYFSYNLHTKVRTNVSKDIHTELKTIRANLVTNVPVGLAGWRDDGERFLLYDNYDLWEIDLSGRLKARNITRQYGHLHKIKFFLLDRVDVPGQLPRYKEDDTLILTAYDANSKKNGFFRVNLLSNKVPELLAMEDILAYQVVNIWAKDGMFPVKAKNKNTWIVRRESASEYPNYFVTPDFKSYQPLSNIHPEKKYNWFSSELATWKQTDGKSVSGIVYKPENFNPKNKYPVIFRFYEDESHQLHSFLMPEFSSTGEINIPTYVSNGYVVVIPDIHMSIATMSNKTTGENAHNSVMSAARYFSKFSWVDSSRMAINGHSTGGGEVNYILANSKIFAAAAEGAGVSDNVSDYGTLSGGGESRQFRELSMGATLFDRSDLYIRNSAVFKAKNVTTPLLIMHNKADGSVPWAQGVELFLALRRVEKKVWMLQYDKGGHSVSGSDAIDYSIRMQQFFDHYLKSAPAPIWMTQGIPAKLKGVITGYDLDPSGNCGKDCKVCKMWNEKMKKDSTATWKEIEEKTKTEHWMGGGEK